MGRHAFGLNDAGDVVGWTPSDAGTHAALWHDGTMVDLGTLPGDDQSGALDVNDPGAVVGSSSGVDPGPPAVGRSRAVLWQNGNVSDLGTLPDGVFSAGASAINAAGHIAGAALLASGIQHAVLWREGTIVDLGTLVPPDAGIFGATASLDVNGHETSSGTRSPATCFSTPSSGATASCTT